MSAIIKTKEQLNGLIVQCDHHISQLEKKVAEYRAAKTSYQHALNLLEVNETEESRLKFEELVRE